MEKKTSLSIALSQEELFVVVRYLKIPRFLGLNNQLLADLPEESQGLVLGVAERALLARGFLEINEGLLEVTPAVQAIIGTCAAPEKTLAVKCDFTNQIPEDYYFHVLRKMKVVHLLPMTAIHQFTMVKDNAALLRVAFATMKLQEPKNMDEFHAEIPQPLIVQAQEAAREGSQAKLTSILKSVTEIEPGFIDAFSNSLIKPHKNILVAFVQHSSKNQGQMDGFSILVGDIYMWMLSPLENGKILVTSTKPQLVRDALHKMCVI